MVETKGEGRDEMTKKRKSKREKVGVEGNVVACACSGKSEASTCVFLGRKYCCWVIRSPVRLVNMLMAISSYRWMHGIFEWAHSFIYRDIVCSTSTYVMLCL